MGAQTIPTIQKSAANNAPSLSSSCTRILVSFFHWGNAMVEKPNDVPTLKLPIVTTKVPKI